MLHSMWLLKYVCRNVSTVGWMDGMEQVGRLVRVCDGDEDGCLYNIKAVDIITLITYTR